MAATPLAAQWPWSAAHGHRFVPGSRAACTAPLAAVPRFARAVLHAAARAQAVGVGGAAPLQRCRAAAGNRRTLDRRVMGSVEATAVLFLTGDARRVDGRFRAG